MNRRSAYILVILGAMMMASCVKEEIAHDNNDGIYRMVETSISLSVANDSNADFFISLHCNYNEKLGEIKPVFMRVCGQYLLRHTPILRQ